MEQTFTFINVNDRFDMNTAEGMSGLYKEISRIFPAWTGVDYDPHDRNGYLRVRFLASAATETIGDVIYE